MKQISEMLIQSIETKPSEINRHSRPLTCSSFWKAIEFRTFHLKLDPVVLRNHLSEESYNHFLSLFCATTICTDKDFLPYIDVATKLFLDFVAKFGDGDNYSAFKGESNLVFSKRLIRGGYKLLQPIANRIQELETVEKLEAQVPKKEVELKHNILMLTDFWLDSSEKNGWIKDQRIFKIERIDEQER